jgi:uncharacterized protein (DUF305 family)
MSEMTGRLRLDSSGPARKTLTFRVPALVFFNCVMAAALCSLPAAAALAQQAAAGSGSSAPAPIVEPGPPGAPSKVLPPSTSAVAPRASQADIDFMQGMIMHHQQAVEMTALIPSHTENKDVRAIGARISRSQSDEIIFMKRWLVARGESTSMAMPGMPDMDKNGHAMLMPGMLTPQQMEALRQARGAEFDRLFLTGMIQHHGGALVMVKDLFASPGAGQDADLFDFATDVDSGQRAEIRIMQNMLKENQ